MSRRIEDLLPEVQPKARSFLSLITIPYVITSTLRTKDEQIALYCQGRAPLGIVNLIRKRFGLPAIGVESNNVPVTNCDGLDTLSKHQGGRAMDVVPADVNGRAIWPPNTDPRWKMIALAGKAAGFEWGGDWDKFQDYPHYQA
jgi:peptidoglycan L-alanyl-D-glutamate endopeptidase CwlK